MLQVRAIKNHFRRNDLSLFIDDVPTSRGQPYRIGSSIVFREASSDDLFKTDICPPPVTLEPDAAQKLMDDLWDCGLRPSEGSGSAGQLAAVQKHLEDFRTMLFKKMGVEK